MENASKALLMAGGVLMAILVISMLVLMFSNLTNVFSEGNQANREAQIVKFNMEYESYNRKDDLDTNKKEGVRGTEILSLLAKVHDYNEYKSDYEGTQAGYSPITVNIDMDGQRKKLEYDENESKVLINNMNIQSKETDFYNETLLKIKTDAKTELKKIGGSRKKSKEDEAELSESDLETLTASLDLIQRTTENVQKTNFTILEIKEIQKTLALMQRIFNPEELKDLEITKSDDNGITKLNNFLNSKYSDITKYAKQYYQYQQFKKSYFDCEGVTYDENTGRVKQLDFKYTGTGD